MIFPYNQSEYGGYLSMQDGGTHSAATRRQRRLIWAVVFGSGALAGSQVYLIAISRAVPRLASNPTSYGSRLMARHARS